MTKTEKRILFLLRKFDRPLRRSEIGQKAWRSNAKERAAALVALEGFGLIMSGEVKTRGRTPTIYWLTAAGKEHVADMIERGELKDPKAA